MNLITTVLKIIVILANFFCLWTFLSACYYTAHTETRNYFGLVITLSILSLTYAVFLVVDIFFMKFYTIYQWLKIVTAVAAILSNIAAYLLTSSLSPNSFSVIAVGNAYFATICFFLHVSILSNPQFRIE